MLLLGVDIGTSSCKITVFDFGGKVVATATKSYKTYYPALYQVEQKPGDWWNGFCAAMTDITKKVRPIDIVAVGVAGQSWSAIVVDRVGDVLYDNPIWMDNRATDACAYICDKVPANEIFDICGNLVEPMYTTPKILWFKNEYPDVYKRAYKIMQSNSYMVYKLTGEYTHDLSQGYGLHFFDMQKGKWDIDIALALGIDPNLMPDLFCSSHIVGSITKEAARATGLLEGTPVVAGGLDAACSTLGAGVIEPGQTQAQGGTAGGMSLCLEKYKTHPKLIMSQHVIKNRWLLQGGTVGGGGVLRWLKDHVLGLGYDEMSILAAKSTLGSGGLVFLPYMSGERSPIWDKNAQGVFFGLDYSKTNADIIRAAMEGVAFSLLHNLDTAHEVGVNASTFNLVGGIANSETWLQILADVTGKTICIPSSDTGTNLGAAILAGMGIGVYANADDAVRKTISIKNEISPCLNNHEKYKRYYQIYRKLYQNTKQTMKELSELRD